MKVLGNQSNKRQFINKIVKNEIQLDDYILSEEYYLTNLDLWALASLFNLPVILFTSTTLQNLNLEQKWILLGGNPKTNTYFFVRSPADTGSVPYYHLITPAYHLRELKQGFYDQLEDLETQPNRITLEAYLSSIAI